MFFSRRACVILVGMQSIFMMLSSQTNLVPLVTQVTIHDADSIYRHSFIYSDKNLKSLETVYVLKGDNWFRRLQTEWIYSNNRCVDQYFRKWESGSWQNNDQIHYEYVNDTISRITRFAMQNGILTPQSKSEFTFDSFKLQSKSDFTWNENDWTLLRQINYTYDGDRLLEQNLKEYSLNNEIYSEFKNKYHYNKDLNVDSIVTYGKNGQTWFKLLLSKTIYDPKTKWKISEFSKKWNDVYLFWENVQNISYQYDLRGRLIAENYQNWDASYWVNDLKYQYAYNQDGTLASKITFWPIYNDYRMASSVSYSDFQYGKASLIEAKNEFWGGEEGTYLDTFIPYQLNSENAVVDANKIEISYIPVDDTLITGIYVDGSNLIQIYPNPSKGIFYFDSEKNDVQQWSVYDLAGKLLMTNAQKERTGVIDLNNYKAGVYLFKAETTDGTKTQKLMKQ